MPILDIEANIFHFISNGVESKLNCSQFSLKIFQEDV